MTPRQRPRSRAGYGVVSFFFLRDCPPLDSGGYLSVPVLGAGTPSSRSFGKSHGLIARTAP